MRQVAQAQCGATFAEFGVGVTIADLYVCEDVKGHVAPHMDFTARKTWLLFDPPPCTITNSEGGGAPTFPSGAHAPVSGAEGREMAVSTLGPSCHGTVRGYVGTAGFPASGLADESAG